MTFLAQHLDSLRLSDGQPDIVARRQEWEIRSLRSQLDSIPFRKDICVDLPLELLLCVSKYLSLEDFVRVCSVSRQWEKAFTHPEICFALTKLYFPLTWESFNKISEPEQQKIQKQSLVNWLPQAASKRVSRLWGRFHSMSAHRYEVDASLEAGAELPLPQYCSGRIAYNKDRETILVRNLRTNSSVLIMEENRVQLKNWLLSDQFIVAWKENPVSLIAFPLETTQDTADTATARLPNGVRHISAYHRQVGIITTENEALVWAIGGTLKSLAAINTPEQRTVSKEELIGIRFHPVIEQSVFIISINMVQRLLKNYKRYMLELLVREYVNGNFRFSYKFNFIVYRYNEDGNCKSEVIGLEDGSIGILLSNHDPESYGCYFEDEEVYELGASCLTRDHVIKFDVSSRTFSTCYYHVKNRKENNDLPLFRTLLWRDVALCATHILFNQWGSFTKYIYAMGLKKCCKSKNTPAPLLWHGGIERGCGRQWDDHDDDVLSDHWNIRRVSPEFSNHIMAYCWLGDLQTGKDLRNDEYFSNQKKVYKDLGNANIRGDDDFVVLFDWNSYIVWNFDEKVKVSSASCSQ